MRHEAQVLPVVVPDVHQVQGIAEALVEMQEIDRQAVVERIAAGVHDFRRGKQRLDEADEQKILATACP